ncbi:MAG: CBS domain-containing protein [Chloroflexi bacterium]|nr:CBS domain-containing protein [Chloroflexota bacterium]
MKTAQDIMSAPAISVQPGETLQAAAERMLANKVSCLPVVDEKEHVIGIVTHTDFSPRERQVPFSSQLLPFVLGEWASFEEMENSYRRAANRPVREVMIHPVFTVEADEPVTKVIEILVHQRVRRLPVVEKGRLVGLIARHDLLKLVAEIKS